MIDIFEKKPGDIAEVRYMKVRGDQVYVIPDKGI